MTSKVKEASKSGGASQNKDGPKKPSKEVSSEEKKSKNNDPPAAGSLEEVLGKDQLIHNVMEHYEYFPDQLGQLVILKEAKEQADPSSRSIFEKMTADPSYEPNPQILTSWRV